MHEEALTDKAAELFPHFRRFSQFYLVGGTGLALQIGHRRSVDFDFFTKDALPNRLLERVKRVFSPSPIAVTYRAAEQLNVTIYGIKTTFFHYPYPLIERPVTHRGVRIATVPEIAAMKAFAIGQRLSYKDYVDWYFLLKGKHVELGYVIELAKRKFGGDFNDRLFLGQLVSLQDIPTQKIDFLRGEVGRKAIEKLLEGVVRRLMDKSS